jgi:hypothetical protein
MTGRSRRAHAAASDARGSFVGNHPPNNFRVYRRRRSDSAIFEWDAYDRPVR